MTSCALTPTVGAQDEPLPLHDRSETRRKGVDHFHRGRHLENPSEKAGKITAIFYSKLKLTTLRNWTLPFAKTVNKTKMWPDCIAQSTTWSGTVPSAYIDLTQIQNGQSEWHLSNSKLGFKKVCRTSPNVPQYEQLLTLLVPSKAQIELTKLLRQRTQLKLIKQIISKWYALNLLLPSIWRVLERKFMGSFSIGHHFGV